MCGICGIINFKRKEPNLINGAIRQMLDFLSSRGPDAQLQWQEGPIALGHARLSIIDLSESANQPMNSLSGQTTIVFNGEIYNYQVLKVELLQLGAKFSNNSDTEVILNGFELWGIDVLLEKIDGMFAFALYDKAQQKSYLVRDRLGKKPLYYYHNNDALLFSSDIRSVQSLVQEKLTIDFEALDYYLTELSSPQPKTIWKEIKQLEPASYLCIDIPKGSFQQHTFWKLSAIEPLNLSMPVLVEETEKRLLKAIQKRLVGDVPIGCFLSGGVDSGLVVSLLAANSSEQVNTFTIGFTAAEMNEMPEARIVAARYNTNHQEIFLEPNVLEVLPELIAYLGEPFADSSLIPSHYVCKALGSHVKVALSGDGGDELFGGYNDYGLAYRSYAFGKENPASIGRNAMVLWDKVYGKLISKKENMGAYVDYLSWPGAKRLYRQMGFGDTRQLYNTDFKETSAGYTQNRLQVLWDEYAHLSMPNNLMSASLNTRLLNDYLVKVDRASMYNSLEVRSPFLDIDLLNFAFSIPLEQKFYNNTNKYLLKTIAKSYIDLNIEKRPKRGFSIPIHEWLRKEMKPWARNLIFDRLLTRNNWFDKKYIQQIWEEHQSSIRNQVHKIWALICLELWFEHCYKIPSNPEFRIF